MDDQTLDPIADVSAEVGVARMLLLWLLRLFAWDGLLPVVVWSLPAIVEAVLPQKPLGLIEMIAVFLPILAFFIRYYVGAEHILRNTCSERTQRIQFFSFCVGILTLVFVDAIMILSHVMPNNQDPLQSEGFRWTIVVYLALMAFSMFPGWPERDPDEREYF